MEREKTERRGVLVVGGGGNAVPTSIARRVEESRAPYCIGEKSRATPFKRGDRTAELLQE